MSSLSFSDPSDPYVPSPFDLFMGGQFTPQDQQDILQQFRGNDAYSQIIRTFFQGPGMRFRALDEFNTRMVPFLNLNLNSDDHVDRLVHRFIEEGFRALMGRFHPREAQIFVHTLRQGTVQSVAPLTQPQPVPQQDNPLSVYPPPPTSSPFHPPPQPQPQPQLQLPPQPQRQTVTSRWPVQRPNRRSTASNRPPARTSISEGLMTVLPTTTHGSFLTLRYREPLSQPFDQYLRTYGPDPTIDPRLQYGMQSTSSGGPQQTPVLNNYPPTPFSLAPPPPTSQMAPTTRGTRKRAASSSPSSSPPPATRARRNEQPETSSDENEENDDPLQLPASAPANHRWRCPIILEDGTQCTSVFGCRRDVNGHARDQHERPNGWGGKSSDLRGAGPFPYDRLNRDGCDLRRVRRRKGYDECANLGEINEWIRKRGSKATGTKPAKATTKRKSTTTRGKPKRSTRETARLQQKRQANQILAPTTRQVASKGVLQGSGAYWQTTDDISDVETESEEGQQEEGEDLYLSDGDEGPTDGPGPGREDDGHDGSDPAGHGLAPPQVLLSPCSTNPSLTSNSVPVSAY